MSSNQTRFGQIKRGQKFIYNGEVWIRTKGTFARREGGEVPFYHWPFSVEEIVEKVEEPRAYSPFDDPIEYHESFA